MISECECLDLLQVFLKLHENERQVVVLQPINSNFICNRVSKTVTCRFLYIVVEAKIGGFSMLQFFRSAVNDNINCDNLYGVVTRPYCYKGALQAPDFHWVSLSEQIACEFIIICKVAI